MSRDSYQELTLKMSHIIGLRLQNFEESDHCHMLVCCTTEENFPADRKLAGHERSVHDLKHERDNALPVDGVFVVVVAVDAAIKSPIRAAFRRIIDGDFPAVSAYTINHCLSRSVAARAPKKQSPR